MAAVEASKTSWLRNPLEAAKLEMKAGEKLVWAEAALAKNVRRRMIPISLFGWLFLVLSLVWINKAAIASVGLLFMGLPFVLLSLGMATIPWWWPTYARCTVYAISDQRLLIIRSLLKHQVWSYGPGDIDVVERRENQDGSGDLIFRREEMRKLRHHHDHPGKKRVGEREVGFLGIPDVRLVEEAVWELKQKGEQSDIGSSSNQRNDGDQAYSVIDSSISFNQLPRPRH